MLKSDPVRDKNQYTQTKLACAHSARGASAEGRRVCLIRAEGAEHADAARVHGGAGAGVAAKVLAVVPSGSLSHHRYGRALNATRHMLKGVF